MIVLPLWKHDLCIVFDCLEDFQSLNRSVTSKVCIFKWINWNVKNLFCQILTRVIIKLKVVFIITHKQCHPLHINPSMLKLYHLINQVTRLLIPRVGYLVGKTPFRRALPIKKGIDILATMCAHISMFPDVSLKALWWWHTVVDSMLWIHSSMLDHRCIHPYTTLKFETPSIAFLFSKLIPSRWRWFKCVFSSKVETPIIT